MDPAAGLTIELPPTTRGTQFPPQIERERERERERVGNQVNRHLNVDQLESKSFLKSITNRSRMIND